MDARNNIAQDLFYKIRSRFSGLKLGAETGEITINPDEARFFDFDYMEGEQPIGHVSISLAEPNSMKVYFSHGITEAMDQGQKNNWYGFLKELRQFAKRRLLSFDTRDIAKDNLDKRDYQFLAQNAQPKPTQPNTIQQPVGESVMNESAMYGTKNVSYQNLMDTRLIIKHSQAVMDDAAPGARARHISALFVENQDGERFKYPFIHLAGARAMQRHVANGGVPYDDIGKSIVKMSEEIAQLKSFGNYVVRNDLMNSDTNSVVEQSTAYLNQLREQIKALAKQSHYEAYKENFQAQQDFDIPQDVVEDFKDKFTVRSFKEDIATVFPVLYRLMQEENKIGYDDIVAMTQEELQNEDVELERDQDEKDPFDQFESWVMALGEEGAIQSVDRLEQEAGIKQLQELVDQELPAGVDGVNAVESLKGLIEDPSLFRDIKEVASSNPDADVRGLIRDWLTMNLPDVAEQVDFGDLGMEDPMAYANAAADADAIAYGQQESSVNEARPDEYELEEIPFAPLIYWDESGKLTKVMEEDTDILPGMDPEDVKELEYQIEAGDFDEMPAQVEIYLNVTVEYEYHEEERGGWSGGQQIDPDYPEWYEPIGVYLDGGPQRVDVSDLVNMEKIEDSLNNMLRDSIEPQAESEEGEPEEQSKQKLDSRELAEFIHSFYDKESGTFPKGPEGVCTMVGKKFGEQAEQVARKFVERMAPQQTTEQNPELAELARIRELSGL